MKYPRALLAFWLICAPVTAAFTRENPYDLFAKALAPFLNLVASESQNPNRALVAELALAGSAPGKVGSTVRVEMEYPDKLRLRSDALGSEMTVCRSGQEIWVAPAAPAEALIDAAAPMGKAEKKYRLANFALPFPQQQLVFLPALFSIEEAENEVVEGVKCRVLDVELMSQLAQGLGVEDWSARVWLRDDATPAKIRVANGEHRYTALVRSAKFGHALPAETWQAPAQDVLRLTPGRYKQLLDQLTARLGGR